jgi:cell division protein FtsI/penicillin-binding protein 2
MSSRLLRALPWLVIAVILVLALRLFLIQIVHHDFYMRLAEDQWEKKITLPAPRGNLYDRLGTPLAVSGLRYRVTADPVAYRSLNESKRQNAIGVLAEILGRKPRELGFTLAQDGRYEVLKDNFSPSLAQRERLEKLSFVHLERVTRRLYPLDALGGPVLGLVNAEGQGVSGLEAGLQKVLAGEPGLAIVQKDKQGRPLISARNRVIQEPQPGGDAFLTIDHKVQAIADLELERAVLEGNARQGCAVILDPRTGDLLALASWPRAKSRNSSTYQPQEWKLLPVQAVYEPGSTLKAITSIALLEQGGVTLDTPVDSEDGDARVQGFTINDDRPHNGMLNFKQAFSLSSNICFAKLSARVSDQELFRTLQDAGFGNRYGLVLPGEESGLLRKPNDWSGRSRMTLIFGQELSATPLQITAAFGALANDGTLMKPRILRATKDAETGAIEEVKPMALRSICRPATARLLRDLMGVAVKEGTGKKAAVAGLSVGGKTGTAQKFENGQVKHGVFMASFVGMAPLDHPSLVIGVFLDEPDYAHSHGGQSAAPAFARMVDRLAVATPYLWEPKGDQQVQSAGASSLIAPSFLDLPVEQAMLRAQEANLSARLDGWGQRIIAQQPAPGCRLAPDQTLALILGDPPSPDAKAPDLLGLSLRDARRRALERGYLIRPSGQGWVLAQGEVEQGPERVIPLELSDGSQAEAGEGPDASKPAGVTGEPGAKAGGSAVAAAGAKSGKASGTRVAQGGNTGKAAKSGKAVTANKGGKTGKAAAPSKSGASSKNGKGKKAAPNAKGKKPVKPART